MADREVFIGVEPWDGVNYATSQVGMCGQPHVHENREIWVYHIASRFRGPKEIYPEEYHPYFDDAGAIYLAKLRLDGFVSLDAGRQGTVVSKPFAPSGGGLQVNVEAQRGEVRAEVLDGETMEPLPGLSASQCDPLSGDHLDGRLTWGDAALPRRERPVRVRFLLRDASLYAFWLRP